MKYVLKDSKPTFFLLMQRNRMQNKGSPKIQNTIKGTPNARAQIRC